MFNSRSECRVPSSPTVPEVVRHERDRDKFDPDSYRGSESSEPEGKGRFANGFTTDIWPRLAIQ